MRTYNFPSIDLLDKINTSDIQGCDSSIRELQITLRSFKIKGTVLSMDTGVRTTLYKVRLDPGVKVSKIQSCAADIALSQGVNHVRISTIPEEKCVAIEAPNKKICVLKARQSLQRRIISG